MNKSIKDVYPNNNLKEFIISQFHVGTMAWKDSYVRDIENKLADALNRIEELEAENEQLHKSFN